MELKHLKTAFKTPYKSQEEELTYEPIEQPPLKPLEKCWWEPQHAGGAVAQAREENYPKGEVTR